MKNELEEESEIARRERKIYAEDPVPNLQTFLHSLMSNEELVGQIEKYLCAIQKNLPKWFCLYLDIFNAIKHHIDFRGIQKDL